jgi:hypothetical protein
VIGGLESSTRPQNKLFLITNKASNALIQINKNKETIEKTTFRTVLEKFADLLFAD